MTSDLPSGLLEACVVVGANTDTLQQLCQGNQPTEELPLLEAEVLQVHAPPFVTKETVGGHAPAFSRVQRRRSFIRKRRERGAEPNGDKAKAGNGDGGGGATEDISVPKDIDIIALPQLCFPGGLQIANEQREDSYHFLVFTDVFGNRTYGVVVQYYTPIQGGLQSSQRASKPRLHTAYGICLISKHPYYTALRDCLSCLLAQLKPSRTEDMEEKVKEFSAKLALVPIPPPGQLHVVFSLRPLQVFLPSQEDQDQLAVDLDLHLALLCLSPAQLLQVLGSLLMEQRVVLFSRDWARLTLLAQGLLLFLGPLPWLHPLVPLLSRHMLDFLQAPTAFLMGCHSDHYEEVAAETDDLVLVNIDDGTVTSSGLDLPDFPEGPRARFTRRVLGLQVHYDLEECQRGVCVDVNELRGRRRTWQRRLNTHILNTTLELLVNTFREVLDHLNYEHRVFNSQEFLRSRDPADQPFYRKVLDTHIFHSFLRDRLNRKLDAFMRLELNTRTEAHRLRAMTESPRRPPLQELARHYSPEQRLSRQLGGGGSLPNLALRNTSVKKLPLLDAGLKGLQKPIRTFKLPEFPPPLAYHYVQNYYAEVLVLLGKEMAAAPPEDSALLARYHYLRGVVNTLAARRLDALDDFQNLYKTDTAIFPAALVKGLVASLGRAEQTEAERRPDLRRLLSRVRQDQDPRPAHHDAVVKRFQLPKKHMQLEEFIRHVQESGVVKDLDTIHRLFDALTVGQQKMVDPEVFRVFYTFWKETEAEAQDVALPGGVAERLEEDECVFKLSSSVKTSRGVGRLAMTQRRLFLLTEGRPGYVEVAKFRDIEEVKVSSALFLLMRVPCLKIRVAGKREGLEANLKAESDLWNLMVKEMWAGRKMADEHKDPQYVQHALANALLMDAVVGCLQTQKAVYAASKLAHYHRMTLEVPMMVPRTTSETLKHKINPSQDQAAPQAVTVLLYTPGQLNSEGGGGTPKLWVALGDGRVVVFDAASWSLQHSSVQAGAARLTCMLGVDPQQVWVGSQDSVIYIISSSSMSCNKQLTHHRSDVTGLALGPPDKYSQQVVYSCSAEGVVMAWDSVSLQVRRQFSLTCGVLASVQPCGGTLWCCARDCVMEVWRSGTLHRRTSPTPTAFSCLLVFPEREQLWTACVDSGEVCVWHQQDLATPFHRVQLADCAGVTCMIKVKNQVWVGGRGQSEAKPRGKIYVVDVQRHLVDKVLAGHSDAVETLSSAEDRYVLSGAGRHDGKIAIWKVE